MNDDTFLLDLAIRSEFLKSQGFITDYNLEDDIYNFSVDNGGELNYDVVVEYKIQPVVQIKNIIIRI